MPLFVWCFVLPSLGCVHPCVSMGCFFACGAWERKYDSDVFTRPILFVSYILSCFFSPPHSVILLELLITFDLQYSLITAVLDRHSVHSAHYEPTEFRNIDPRPLLSLDWDYKCLIHGHGDGFLQWWVFMQWRSRPWSVSHSLKYKYAPWSNILPFSTPHFSLVSLQGNKRFHSLSSTIQQLIPHTLRCSIWIQ